MSNVIKLTDQDVLDLQKQIDEKKRLVEYEKLKKELAEITKQPTEFDSAMKYSDTDKVLQSKGKKSFINSLFDRLTHMLSPRPVTGNFISLGIITVVLIFSRSNIITNIGGNDITEYLPYIGYFALVVGGLQIIKSSTRSLLIPVLATVIGGVFATSMNPDTLVFTLHQVVYQAMFITGLLGLTIGAFTID
ncbi:hypothetical protein IB644_05810 [Allofrancisella guangzhouensis]|uniref:hypothetical protein n=1 Tax=Allofrancisella guangzhouensis TaxID=594679 RepID=UPI001903AF74|nr:hypothetical protein [Allofrancisella guangzhouensis]MBK2046062.1 hypothetical protein [Allofrancisella guangzhouensis]